MGQTNSNFASTEEISDRVKNSEIHLQKRKRQSQVYQGMISRVVKSQKKEKSLFYNLPNPIFHIILSFLAPEIKTLMTLNGFFYHKILEIFDEQFSSIESLFSVIHSNLLSFKRSFLSSTLISTSSISGYRIDRVIVAETLKQLAGYTVTLRFTYKTYSSSYEFKSDFKFDCVKKGKKTVWIHRDESRVHGENNLKAYTSQIINVSAGDFIEFAINWYNLSGLVRISTIKWQTPAIQSTKSILKDLNLLQGNMNKIHLFTARYCEAEIAQTHWYLPEHYNKSGQIFVFDLFEPFLKMIKIEMAGTDITVCKITFKAMRPGIITNSVMRLGILVEVKEFDVVFEVKRMGLLYDRYKPLQLRVNDELVLYVSR